MMHHHVTSISGHRPRGMTVDLANTVIFRRKFISSEMLFRRKFTFAKYFPTKNFGANWPSEKRVNGEQERKSFAYAGKII